MNMINEHFYFANDKKWENIENYFEIYDIIIIVKHLAVRFVTRSALYAGAFN